MLTLSNIGQLSIHYLIKYIIKYSKNQNLKISNLKEVKDIFSNILVLKVFCSVLITKQNILVEIDINQKHSTIRRDFKKI